MAFEASNGTTVPHATDYADLLTKLVTFATANGWTLHENTSDKVVLKSTGSTGTDAIYVAFQKYSDVTNDAYGWYLNNYSGYQGGLLFGAQPGALATNPPALPLWNSSTPYWFIVNARRIIVIAKVSTTYQVAYAGYFLPFATPNQYPAPAMIGGSCATSPTIKPRWSKTTDEASAFVNPKNISVTALYVRGVDGSWVNIKNTGGGITGKTATSFSGVYPFVNGSGFNLDLLRPAISGEYTLEPLYIGHTPSGQAYANLYGEIDGCKYIAGVSNSAENTVTISARTFLVLQNIFRTSVNEYFAIELA